MSRRRVVFLGIDGLDYRYVTRHISELPRLRELAENGVLSPLPSVFPPDSIPAWITIFTGERPDRHGIVESIDYLAKNPAEATENAPGFLRGRTFWDVASARGHRVCVVNPFMAYPPWRVNGVMISGPVFVDAAEPRVEPPGAAGELVLPQLGGIVDFPTQNTMREFVERTLAVTREQTAFGLAMLDKIEPALFFMNILTVDRIQHFLWRYCDSRDPTYPGASDLDDAILRAYWLMDEIVGLYVDRLDDEALLLVASDHGHGMRPPTMLYVDELLRREGLFDTGDFWRSTRTYLLEKAKRGVSMAAFSLGREHEAYALARRLPGRKALKTSTYANGGASIATASRALGRNFSGGVDIAHGITGGERRELALRICGLLLGVQDRDGTRVCNWACPREYLFDGPEAGRFPDVVFELREDVGVDFGVFGPLLAPDMMHRRISGGHLREGIFCASSRDVPFIPKRLDQLHPLVVSSVTGSSP
jgi:predicted AlkP superfamily phosphohydrolase/phosphomutase